MAGTRNVLADWDGDQTVDLHEVAAAWHRLTRPLRDSFRRTHKRKRYVTLSDLDGPLLHTRSRLRMSSGAVGSRPDPTLASRAPPASSACRLILASGRCQPPASRCPSLPSGVGGGCSVIGV